MPSRKFSSSAFNEASLKYLEKSLEMTEEITKKQAKLLELKQKQLEIDKALTKHADSLSKNSDIQREVDARSVSYKTEILNLEKEIAKQKKYDLGLSKEQMQAYIDYGKAQLAEKNAEAKKASIRQLIDESGSGKSGGSYGLKDLGSMLADSYNKNYAAKRLKDAERQYDEIRASVVNEKTRLGWKNINSAESQEIIDKETADIFKKSIEDNGKNLNIFGGILETVGETFKTLVNVVGQMLESGMNKQVDAYNNTFESISVRNDISRQTYRANWRGARNYIDTNGFYDNIGVSEVQQMWGKMAENGITIDMNTNSAQAIQTAVENVVTGKIVPYLDTTSTGWDQLQMWQPTLTKYVRGIGLATNEIVGSSTFITKHLQQLIDDIAPMASLAESEIGVQFAKVSGRYEALRSQGFTDYEIGQAYNNSVQAYLNPEKALTSGSLDQQMAIAQIVASGGDLRDFNTVDRYTLHNSSYLANMTPEGRMGPLYSSILANRGITGFDTQTTYKFNAKNLDMDAIDEMGELVAASALAKGNYATTQFANNKYQTETTLQNVTLENFMTELAVGKGMMGNYFKLIETAIKGIGTLITTKIIGGTIEKGIGALAGIGSGEKGGLLATMGAGGIATAAIIGTLAVAKGIEDSVHRLRIEQNDLLDTKEKNLISQYLDEGMDEKEAYAKASAIVSAEKAAENTGVAHNPGSRWTTHILNNILGMGIPQTVSGISGVAHGLSWDNPTGEGDIYYGTDLNLSKEDKLSKYGIEEANTLTSIQEIRVALNNMAKAREWGKYNNLKLALFKAKYGQSEHDMAVMQTAMTIAALYYNKKSSYISEALKSELGISEISEEEIKTLISTNKLSSASEIQNMLKNAHEYDIYLNNGGSSGKDWLDVKNIPSEYLNQFNLHRMGLNKVPYDNYPALLHEGEAVLTADTANQMRSMIDEYRETRNQMQNIDVIIGEQTAALVMKMDEIIKYMKIGGIGDILPDSATQQKAKARLWGSLLHMTSTKNMFS